MVALPEQAQTDHRHFGARVRVVDETDTTTAVVVDGECDLTAAPELTEIARRVIGEGRNLIIDLTDASFIDAATVRTLLTTHAAARERGCDLVVQLGENTFAGRVLSITGADKRLATAVTRRGALQLVAAPAY
jgi:anti-anti-sigma factor